MSQNSISPIDNPFGFLWLTNCVIVFNCCCVSSSEGMEKTESARRSDEKCAVIKARRFLKS